MFVILDRPFQEDNYGTDEFLYNWPMVYILENGKEAYVGQTLDISTRMSQHKANPDKAGFTRAHFIYSDHSNQSMTFDYESQLIALMSADETFTLTNKNSGIVGASYYNRDIYNDKFRMLWAELQNKHLVQHSIEEIEQSDLFKYSPYKKLTTDQRNVVSTLIQHLRVDRKQIMLIQGMPGSGKTVVAVYLFKLLRDSPEFTSLKMALVIPQTSLRDSLKKLFKSIRGLSASDVIGPVEVASNHYDILMVDEAHRLKARHNLANYSTFDKASKKIGLDGDVTQLDWIIKQTDCPILFYDTDQTVITSDISADDFQKTINDQFYNRMRTFYTLCTQMRCKGGNDYINFVKKLVKGREDSRGQFPNYTLKLVMDFKNFDNKYREVVSKEPLSRMIAGYSWEWKSKNDKDKYDIFIENVQKQWNSTNIEWPHSFNAVNEVGSIHTIQGYDLNYGFVIFGREIDYDFSANEIVVNRDLYFDKYGKLGTTDDELRVYIENIYYVLMTRGIDGTYVYAYNQGLRKYFSNYMECL